LPGANQKQRQIKGKQHNSTTMIDFMDTRIGEVLRKGQMLSDAAAWFDTFDYKTNRQILDWIREDQLTKEGIDEDGNVVGYYSLLTELISGGRKKFNTPFTLDDTGEFYRSMFIIALKDSIVIDADGQKGEDNLFELYGDGIIGLTDENMDKLRAIVREKHIEYARRALGVD
jgi:hypothetical protein